MEAAERHMVSKLSVETARFTHQVESRAMSASAAATRAAETKIDFMVVILTIRKRERVLFVCRWSIDSGRDDNEKKAESSCWGWTIYMFEVYVMKVRSSFIKLTYHQIVR